MDPPRRPSRPEGHLQAPETPRRSPSPSEMRFPNFSNPATPNPATPSAVSEVAADYFDPLSAAPSNQSRISLPRIRSRPTSVASPRPALENTGRLPSIRLRRRSSNTSLASTVASDQANDNSLPPRTDGFHSRPRSISQPERTQVSDVPGLARHSRRVPQIAMPRLTEEGGRPSLAELGLDGTQPISPSRSLPETGPAVDPVQAGPEDSNRLQRTRKFSRMFWPRKRNTGDQVVQAPLSQDYDDEYEQELVDWLDIIDPEVQTLSTLTNMQNSLFVPNLGNLVNRRPTYVLSDRDLEQQWARGAISSTGRREAEQRWEAGRREAERQGAEPISEDLEVEPPSIQRSSTITSRLTDSHYAALPHGESLEGWTAEEKRELDDHVRHMLHSRRARFKRRLKGFGQYVRRPLGFFVTLYATLITLFGLAWVLFLIGWIYVGEKQVYAIHIIDSVLVALFAIMGDGLAPFRAVDTYHMFFIARYSRKISRAEKGKMPRSRLKKKTVPEEIRGSIDLQNGGRLTSQQAREILRAQAPFIPENEAARTGGDQTADLENTNSKSSDSTEHDLPALTWKQLKSLQHHQKKFSKSHSFYKPQETFTHHAFPLSYLIAIVLLLDFHSCLQISLGACTWGIDYHTRPFALTTVILCVSITANVTAGLLISIGDRKTRKKDVWELLNRQELTGDAIKHMAKKKREQEEKEREQEEKEKEQENSDGQSESSSSRMRKLIKLPS